MIARFPELPTAADWGWNVSVCIALLCERRQALVTVCDQKVSFGGYSADHAAIKNAPFGRDCCVLFAGDDVEYAEPIINRAFDFCVQEKKFGPRETAFAIDAAYAEVLHGEIERKVLRKRGFNVSTFRDKGKQLCTPSAYLGLCSRVDQVSISLKFLICGFLKKMGEAGPGHIYCVDGESEPKCYDPIGMWAIGSGAYSAMSWLAFHADKAHISSYSSLPEAVYFAATAKFMAETSGDVGRGSFTVILEHAKPPSYISPTSMLAIRKFWERCGVPPLPKGIKEKMASHIIPWGQNQKSPG